MEKVLFVNVTRQCNVQCDRCYLTLDNRKRKERLSPSVFDELVGHPWFTGGPLLVIWEGGEASLIGRERFNELVATCKQILPQARQTMVTNLLTAPDWLIELSHQYFSSRFETTFALDRKYTIGGSRDVFLDQFATTFRQVADKGIQCLINVETNKETIEAGPAALLDYLERIGAKEVEFDISVDFERFHKNPSYDLSGYPILPNTAEYVSLSRYLIELWEMVQAGRLGGKIVSTLFDQCMSRNKSLMFAIQKSFEFITLNPDGTVTTNPLFSDLVPTYLGKIGTDSAESIMSSAKRERFLRYEIRRTKSCLGCEYFEFCGAGPSHVVLEDGSGECSGLKNLWNYFG